jgi:hypothetical protein
MHGYNHGELSYGSERVVPVCVELSVLGKLKLPPDIFV